MKCNLSFALFRIMAGITMLVGGYSKTITIFRTSFHPSDFGLFHSFINSFQGTDAMMPLIYRYFSQSLLFTF